MITLSAGLEIQHFLRILIGRKLLTLALQLMKIMHGQSISVHQDIEILNKTFSCMTNNEFWETVDRIPDLAFKRNLQIRLMGNFGLQYGALWLRKSGSSSCLLCKYGNVEDIFQFLFACHRLEDEWATFWCILKEKVSNSDYLEKIYCYNLFKIWTDCGFY